MKKVWTAFSVLILVATALALAPVVTATWDTPSQYCSTPLTCTYNIYRGPTSGSEQLIKAGITTDTYQDTSTTRGQKYCYQVSATNIYGEGPRSSERCLTIPSVPNSPGNFGVTSN